MRTKLLVALCCLPFFLHSQVLPEFGPLFPQDEVAEVHITIHPDSLAAILHPDSLFNDHEYPATFVYIGSGLNDTIQNVGFRLRGNTSRLAEKKSFKVSFNTFQSGQKYQGLEKMNLNGSHNDPSGIRVKLFWDLFREVGIRGSRTAHMKLYVNQEYKGVYTHVEHIDEEFVDRYFQHGDGNLFKCLYPADLNYISSDPNAYKVEFFGRRIYDLKTNNLYDDYSGFANFIGILNNAPLAVLECELDKVFDVDSYLRILAIDVLCGNWDNYAYNQNNFYLYQDPSDDKFYYIPYDLDNVLGIDWLGIDWTVRDPYNWSPGPGQRPLYDRMLQVPAWRNKFSQYLSEFAETYFSGDYFLDRGSYMHGLLAEAAQEDLYYNLDYGFSYEDFQNSLTQSWGGHVSQGIQEYASLRYQSLAGQLELFDPVPVIHYFEENTPLLPDQDLVLHVETDPGVNSLLFRFNYPGEASSDVALDQLGNGIWELIFTPAGNIDYLEYQLVASDGMSEQLSPCQPKRVWLQPNPAGLYINEILASNSNVISDEFGEYEDFVELYNANTAINLGSVYLTNELAEPWRFDLPSFTMDADDYTLFWADNDPEQGPFHGSFRISASGESLYLLRREQSAWRILDYIDVPALPTDFSFARICDGEENWETTDHVTPQISNCTVISVLENEVTPLIVYPNPGSGSFQFNRAITGDLYDASGRIILHILNATQIDLSGVNAGVYVLVTDSGSILRIQVI